MKRNAARSLIIAATVCLLADHATAERIPGDSQLLAPGKNVLIVYLSRTNNTKAVAEIIRRKVGGAMVAIELEKPYPTDYNATVRQVARENETGYLPPLKTKIDRIDQYDVVFVGFPTWGMQLPPPRSTVLEGFSASPHVRLIGVRASPVAAIQEAFS